MTSEVAAVTEKSLHGVWRGGGWPPASMPVTPHVPQGSVTAAPGAQRWKLQGANAPVPEPHTPGPRGARPRPLSVPSICARARIQRRLTL